jgi:hypothetical protein
VFSGRELTRPVTDGEFRKTLERIWSVANRKV